MSTLDQQMFVNWSIEGDKQYTNVVLSVGVLAAVHTCMSLLTCCTDLVEPVTGFPRIA